MAFLFQNGSRISRQEKCRGCKKVIVGNLRSSHINQSEVGSIGQGILQLQLYAETAYFEPAVAVGVDAGSGFSECFQRSIVES